MVIHNFKYLPHDNVTFVVINVRDQVVPVLEFGWIVVVHDLQTSFLQVLDLVFRTKPNHSTYLFDRNIFSQVQCPAIGNEIRCANLGKEK